jgi:hypothetical protein
MEDPRVVVSVAKGKKSGYLELPTSGVVVTQQEGVDSDVDSKETITPPRVPFWLKEDEQIVVSHPTEQKCTLIWEPSGGEVEKRIERQVDSKIGQIAEGERFPLTYYIEDWAYRRHGLASGLGQTLASFTGYFLESWTINAALTFWDRITKRWEREKGKMMRHAIRDYYAGKK